MFEISLGQTTPDTLRYSSFSFCLGNGLYTKFTVPEGCMVDYIHVLHSSYNVSYSCRLICVFALWAIKAAAQEQCSKTFSPNWLRSASSPQTKCTYDTKYCSVVMWVPSVTYITVHSRCTIFPFLKSLQLYSGMILVFIPYLDYLYLYMFKQTFISHFLKNKKRAWRKIMYKTLSWKYCC